MFRRRKGEHAAAQAAEPDEEEFVDDLDEEDRAYEDALLLAELEQDGARVPPARPQGPWDDSDAPDDEVQRLDLGGIRVPVLPGTEVRIDVTPEGEVVAATLVHGQGAVQVNAFAAPRTEAIWPEVLAEIAASLADSGGQTEQVEGPYGPELRAAVPTEVPEQGIVLAPARFVGVDGPRWFLRALYTGAAAVDPDAAAPLEQAVRDVVVVRGSDPMAVRDPLPLRLPAEAQQAVQAGQAGAQEQPDGAGLDLPERGPEITEVR